MIKMKRTTYYLPLVDRVKYFIIQVVNKRPNLTNIIKKRKKVKGEKLVWFYPKISNETLEIIRDFFEENLIPRDSVKLLSKPLHEWNKFSGRYSCGLIPGLEVKIFDPDAGYIKK